MQCSADEARATLEHMDTLQPQPTNTEANIRKAAEAIAEVLQMKQGSFAAREYSIHKARDGRAFVGAGHSGIRRPWIKKTLHRRNGRKS